MKKIFLISIAIALFLVLFSCSKKEEALCSNCEGLNSEDVRVWVDNRYFDCGDGKFKCFQAQISDTINENNWQVWTDTICGFSFEPQYRYKLSVRRKKVGKDAQNNDIYNYCLIKIAQKELMYL